MKPHLQDTVQLQEMNSVIIKSQLREIKFQLWEIKM